MLSLGKSLDKFSVRFLSRRYVFLMDLVISFVISVALAIFIFLLDENVLVRSRAFDLCWGISALAGSALMFLLLKTYVIIIRHFSFKDTLLFGLASLGKAAVMAITLLAFGFLNGSYVFLMLLADALLTMVALCSVRLLMIYVYDAYKGKIRQLQNRSRVLVYGIDDKAVATVTRLRGSKHYEVVGLVSKDHKLEKTLLADKPVHCFDSPADFEQTSKRLSLRGVIFTKDSDVITEQDRLVKYCTDQGVKVLIAPAVDEVSGEPYSQQIRKIKIEDLLGREEIKISMEAIKADLAGKVVMVTGCAGSIGSELCRQLAGFGVSKLILLDNAETPMHNLRLELEERFPSLAFVPIIGDVRQLPRLDYVFRTQRPQVVFHAAAYKHVPLMEENPCEAVLVNVVGSRNVADKCIEYGVEKMVMISTDKAVNPTNVMGCTKRLAEIYVQSLGKAIAAGQVKGRTKFVTTRFGNVLGSNGSVIPRFREQIERGGPVTVTDRNITRFFMTIPEACRLVLEAAVLPTENRICVFDMGKPVKIDSLARKMIELAGLVPDQDIEIVYTGLRPGEKLYEEVLSTKENTDGTSHDRIRIARVREYDYSEAVAAVEQLEGLSREVRIPDLIKLMKEIVPEYISNNSRFEEYDKK